MTDTPAPSRSKRQPAREFANHLRTIPPWQRKVFVIAIVLMGGGLVGQASRLVSKAPPPTTQPVVVASDNATSGEGTTAAPANARGFMSTSSNQSGSASPSDDAGIQPDATIEAPPAPKPTLVEKLSPWATKVGSGFVGGFIIGWAFRAFLKTMAIVTALGLAILWGLSHFNVIHLDIEGAELKFKSGTSWVTRQAEALKEQALTVVPGSFSSVFGMFLGFRRR